LKKFDKRGIIIDDVPVAQWIEHRSPEPVALVRFQSGTLQTINPLEKPKSLNESNRKEASFRLFFTCYFHKPVA
jgi:hypothetical protein